MKSTSFRKCFLFIVSAAPYGQCRQLKPFNVIFLTSDSEDQPTWHGNLLHWPASTAKDFRSTSADLHYTVIHHIAGESWVIGPVYLKANFIIDDNFSRTWREFSICFTTAGGIMRMHLTCLLHYCQDKYLDECSILHYCQR